MKRNGGPIQRWVDSIPSPTKSTIDIQIDRPDSPSSAPECSRTNNTAMATSTPQSAPTSPAITMSGISNRLARDPSLQSDSSHCSSVESLLDLRKPDPESVLLDLGFGGTFSLTEKCSPISRVPKRFLQPSKLKGIVVEEFVKQQQQACESIDSASLGYRGLVGPPHVEPAPIVQKIVERLREHESHELDNYSPTSPDTYPPVLQDGRVSVLSPDNRQYLERQRSKSPDMRNKRMVIGDKLFAFSVENELIEVSPKSRKHFESSGNWIDCNKNGNDSDQSKILNINLPCEVQTEENLKRRIIKQKSIDDGIRLPMSPESTEQSDSSSIDSRQISSLESSKEETKNEENGSQVSLECLRIESEDKSSDTDSLINPRRASDGSYPSGPNLLPSHDEGRRFSDGIVKTSPAEKRRSFKRQARISDAEATLYCESEGSNSLIEETTNILSDSEPLKDFSESDEHICCENDELNQICEHESTSVDCCYCESNTNCWKRVRKLVKKGQIEKNSVVKSNKQDLPEITEMFNNVMSLRMEPGF